MVKTLWRAHKNIFLKALNRFRFSSRLTEESKGRHVLMLTALKGDRVRENKEK